MSCGPCVRHPYSRRTLCTRTRANRQRRSGHERQLEADVPQGLWQLRFWLPKWEWALAENLLAPWIQGCSYVPHVWNVEISNQERCVEMYVCIYHIDIHRHGSHSLPPSLPPLTPLTGLTHLTRSLTPPLTPPHSTPLHSTHSTHSLTHSPHSLTQPVSRYSLTRSLTHALNHLLSVSLSLSLFVSLSLSHSLSLSLTLYISLSPPVFYTNTNFQTVMMRFVYWLAAACPASLCFRQDWLSLVLRGTRGWFQEACGSWLQGLDFVVRCSFFESWSKITANSSQSHSGWWCWCCWCRW